jgi:predicted ATP-grasp superfamily ATP-dependent carboligase
MPLPDCHESPRLRKLLLVGASTRAAAFSAQRAGFEPICIDMFADADLQAVADVRPVRRYPDDVIEAAAAVDPTVPWLYTGGIENHPEIVEEISLRRSLWGNDAATLRLVRDPAWVRDTLQHAGFPSLNVIIPEPSASADPPPRDGLWMLKPLGGAGGRGVCFCDATFRTSPTLHEPHYFQRHATGDSIGALFLAFADRTELIGIARQLVGWAELDAVPFAYCGSIGPVRLAAAAESTIRRVGETLRKAASLRGLFGCDFVFDGETPWLVEVNPRYTASAEILELATGVPLLKWHRRACSGSTGEQGSETLAPHPRPLSPFGGEGRSEYSVLNTQHSAGTVHQAQFVTHPSSLIGKAILYADRDLTATAWPRRVLAASPWSVPFLADIPPAGAMSPANWPLCTAFARGDDEASVLAKLVRRARRVRSRFLESGTAAG